MVLFTGQHNFLFLVLICQVTVMTCFGYMTIFRPTKLQKCNVLKKLKNFASDGLRFQSYSFLEQYTAFILLLYTYTVFIVYVFAMTDKLKLITL